MEDVSLLEIFKNEARDMLGEIENDIILLEEEETPEVINRLFRNFHTLKGSSGIVGLTELSSFTHYLESLLDKSRANLITIDKNYIDLLLKSSDWIKAAIFNPDDSEHILSQKDSIIDQLLKFDVDHGEEITEDFYDKKNSSEPAGTFYYRIKINFSHEIFESGIDPLIIIEDLSEMGEFTEQKVYRDNLPDLEQMDPEKSYLRWLFVLKTEESIDKIDEVFMFIDRDENSVEIDDVTETYVEDTEDIPDEDRKLGDILVRKGIVTEQEIDYILQTQEIKKQKLGELLINKGIVTQKDLDQALGIQHKMKKNYERSTIRVETSKLDVLMNLLGEIVIAQSSLLGIANDIPEEKGYELKNTLYGLDRSAREFQELIMSIRMIPVGPTFTQFKRFVRDISAELNKEIKLVIKGSETELDKTVIEKIGDPLKHMIRNSIDHGIETREDRERAGKDSAGTITLNAYHQEGNVFIEIQDDGRGINFNRIREKAISKGIIGENQKVENDKLISFLFLPGFSTSDQVGDLSGRGVGMDVVKNNIESLNGIIDMKTIEGKGTTIKIKLPLTLAIIEGMLVRIGGHIYIIPLLSIVESVRPEKKDIRSIENKGEMVLIRDEYISLVRLNKYFKIDSDFQEPWEALVVVVESGNTKIALMVDDLIGQQQIVIKSIDGHITSNKSISGAAILGDGTVSLIIDVHGLLKSLSGTGM